MRDYDNKLMSACKLFDILVKLNIKPAERIKYDYIDLMVSKLWVKGHIPRSDTPAPSPQRPFLRWLKLLLAGL